jgi:hypothetical protein
MEMISARTDKIDENSSQKGIYPFDAGFDAPAELVVYCARQGL